MSYISLFNNLRNRISYTCIVLVSLLLASGCSNNEEPIIPSTSKVSESANPNSVEFETAFEDFIISVDSLNAQYQTNEASRSNFNHYFAVSIADQMGYIAGRYAGQWLGGLAGSATGNPVGVGIGMLIGRKVGPHIGYALASATADMLYTAKYDKLDERIASLRNIDSIISDNFNNDIDSTGYYHNIVMQKVYQHYGKYIYGNNVNTRILYEDIVNYYKEFGVYENALSKEITRDGMSSQMQKIAVISKRFQADEITEDDLLNQQVQMLVSYRLPAEEINIYKSYTFELAKTCARLSDAQIRRYYYDMNDLINKSNFNDEYKRELRSTTLNITNSSLCWNF